MFLFFKPHSGIDAGGPGGYVIPRRKPQVTRRRVTRLAAVTKAQEAVTPAEVVKAAKYDELDVLTAQLDRLSIELEIETIKQAQALLEAEIEQAKADEAQRAQEEAAYAMLAAMIAEGERLLAEEQQGVLEVIDLLDSELWAASAAYEFTRPKRKRRK